MFLFELYHQQSKHLLDSLKTLVPKDKWPNEWKTTVIKTYPRFRKIELPTPLPLESTVTRSLLDRTSGRTFKNTVTKEQLSSLLYYSIGEKKDDTDSGHRMYQSAGARYPLEFYLLVFKPVGDIDTGTYHYAVESNALTQLEKLDFTEELHEQISMEPFVQEAHFGIIFTAVFGRTATKYRERAYRHIMIEAGCASQNLAICATALNISAVSVGGTIEDFVEKLIGVDGVAESMVHSMYFG